MNRKAKAEAMRSLSLSKCPALQFRLNDSTTKQKEYKQLKNKKLWEKLLVLT
jgi:ribosome-binding factor A